jgi:hypothetical protein
MRPFVEGLAQLHGVRLIYRTTREELRALLAGGAFDAKKDRFLVSLTFATHEGRRPPRRR